MSEREDRRISTGLAADALRNLDHGNGGERRFLRRFPDRGIAANGGERAFHAQTATGKLKAVMTPTSPSGCHCSIMRCFGRSDAMVRP